MLFLIFVVVVGLKKRVNKEIVSVITANSPSLRLVVPLEFGTFASFCGL